MKFRQIDRILEVVPGERLVAIRTLRADEEYLKDHFPLFPVMPGVLMLEALYQAACCLIRASDEFRPSLLPLREVRNAKFADFVSPGDSLEILVEVGKRDAESVSLKASGKKGETTAVSARLLIGVRSLRDRDPSLEPLDRYIAYQTKLNYQDWLASGLKAT
jgi:3-hydroxyacyl-[acyl-carrier-protein] dehydratase